MLKKCQCGKKFRKNHLTSKFHLKFIQLQNLKGGVISKKRKRCPICDKLLKVITASHNKSQFHQKALKIKLDNELKLKNEKIKKQQQELKRIKIAEHNKKLELNIQKQINKRFQKQLIKRDNQIKKLLKEKLKSNLLKIQKNKKIELQDKEINQRQNKIKQLLKDKLSQTLIQVQMNKKIQNNIKKDISINKNLENIEEEKNLEDINEDIKEIKSKLNIPKINWVLFKEQITTDLDENMSAYIDIKLIKLNKQIERLFQIIREIKHEYINDKNMLILHIADRSYTLTNNYEQEIYNLILNGFLEEEMIEVGSDTEFLNNLISVDSLVIEIIKRNFQTKKSSGFFKYTLPKDSKIKLSKYGIFNQVKVSNYNINCLIRCLMNSGLFPNKIDKKEFKKIPDMDEEFFDLETQMEIDKKNKKLLKDSEKIIMNTKLENLKLMFKDRNIPQCKLEKVCNKLEIHIILKQLQKNKKNGKSNTRTIHYGKNHKNIINIATIDEHYFLNETTKYTMFSIKNYDEIKDKQGWNKIQKKIKNKKGKIIYKKSNKNFIDSFKIIKFLVENKEKYLNKINMSDEIFKSQYYDKIKDIDNLEYDLEKNTKEICYKKRLPLDFNDMVMYDIESITNKSYRVFKCKKCINKNIPCHHDTDNYYIAKNLHAPYLNSAYHIKTNKLKTYFGDDCVKTFLNSLVDKSLIIIHNAKYDFSFMIKYCYNIKRKIEKGSKIMYVECQYKNNNGKVINLMIKDSLSLINMSLSKFQKVFKLKSYKDILPYGAYNEETMYKLTISIKYAESFLKESDKKQFRKNIINLNLLDENNPENFYHIKYSKYYCEMDCKTLAEGYLKFRQWQLDLTDLDINNYVSIASIADTYFKKKLCYKGCYDLSGIPREFIQKTVVGGRTMISYNKKKIIHKLLQDFDAVSLYPSAMARLKYPKGKPKICYGKSQLNLTGIKDIDNLIFEKSNDDKITYVNYEDLQNFDAYFIEIKLTKINKNRGFRLMSYINDNNVRIFSDDIEDYKNRNIFVNNIDLEDMIEFQDIEFEIIRGYYFNEGTVDTIQEIIKIIFRERLKFKSEGNPIQIVYKECMNSGYGKRIMKAIETEFKIFNNKARLDQYLCNNYNKIKYFEQLYNDCKYGCKIIKPINEHFSSPQIGSLILSMSKRIMNEVMCLAEDNDINIYYQDTDSMLLEDSGIKKLRKLFKEKYGRELVGKCMGQFHSDFDYNSDEECVSVKSIFLGKKSYYCKVKTLINGKIIYVDHFRMKGITKEAVLEKSKEFNSIEKMYEYLFLGNKVKFNLLAGQKCKFKFESNYSIKSLQKFERVVQFK